MMREIKKVIVILIAMLFFGSLIVPNFGGADRVDWTPMVMVHDIALDGMPAMTGEYANQTYTITVTVMNNGDTSLTDVNVSCMITSGGNTYLDDYNTSIMSLSIGASDTVDFSWDNIIKDMTYEVNASVMADGFGTMVHHYDTMDVVVADVVSWEVSSIAVWNGTPLAEEIPAYDGSFRFNITDEMVNHTLQAFVKNTGNQMINGPVPLEASMYEAADPTGVTAKWTNESLIAGNIGVGFEASAVFALHFNGSTVGTKTINVSAAGQNDSFQIVMKNVTNFEVTSIGPYMNGSTYSNYTTSIDAVITNTGNIMDVFTYIPGFSATLTIYDNTMTQQYQDIKALTPGELDALKDPADNILITFADINQTFMDGYYHYNVSINPTEGWNGYAMDDFMTINVTHENTTDYDLMIDEPMAGQYDIADISAEEFVATLMNLGTLTLTDDYYLQVDFMSMDSGMVWLDLVNISETTDITGGSEKETNIGSWPAAVDFIGNFTITVTAYRESDDMFMANDTVMVTLANGDLEGTIAGTVYGITQTDQVEVSIWDNTATTRITSVMTTGTGTDRAYSIELPALPAGINYTVAALEADNYWYENVLLNAWAYSGIFTLDIDLTLTAKATSRINGSVMLMAGIDAPDLADDEDWSDVEVMVDGMPSTFMTNDTGHFDQEVVAGTGLNVSAMKPNFMGDYNDSVDVVVGNNTTVHLTLHEMWGVEVTPVHNAMDVMVDTNIVAMFDEEINISTIDGNLTLLDGNEDLVELENITTEDNMTFEVIPMAELENDATYYVHIGEEVMTTADAQAVHRMWHSMFHTEAGLGHVEGWVKDEIGDPIEGVTVSIGAITNTTNATGYYLLENIIAGDTTIKAEMATYEMNEMDVTVVPGETVNVNITLVEIKERIESKSPEDGATDVAVDANIIVTFTVAMNASTVNASTFLVNSKTRAAVEGNITASNDDKTFTFDPTENFTMGETYEWTLKKSMRAADEDVDWYYEDLMYTFTVEEEDEWILVTSTTPAADFDGAKVDMPIIVNFDTAINTTKFASGTGGITISPAAAGTIAWSNGNKTLTWTQDANLTYEQEYTVTIKAANVESEDGTLTLEADYSWKFTTEDDPNKVTPITIVLGPFKEGNDLLEGVKVTIEIDGEKYSDETDALGIASIDLPDTPADGTYKVTATKDGYKDLEYDVTFTGGIPDPTSIIPPDMKAEDDGGIDMMAIIAIIIVVIIIIVLLILVMKPKKPAEEEEAIAEEEEEMEEGEEEFECPECGAVVTSGETVCPECGAEFEEEEFECPECGASVEAGTGVCPECGAEFEEEELEGEEEDEEFEVEDEEEVEAGEEELEEEDEDLDLEEELEEDEDLEDEDLEEELEEEDEDLEDEDLEEELEEEDEDLEDEDEGLEEEDEEKE